ncbi:MAG: DNA recombination protein RmuC [Bacteroidales bacterium]
MELAVGILIGFILGAFSLLLWGKSKDTLISLKDKDVERLRAELAAVAKKSDDITTAYNTSVADNHAKQAVIEARDEQFREQAKQFATQMELVKSQFSEISSDLLKQKTLELGEQNKAQLSPLIDTLKEQMAKVEVSIKETREKGVENKASLDTAIRSMMERTMEIGNEANKLAEALKGKSKMQGIYGELILRDILKRSGLKENEQFVCQDMIKDAQGHPLRNEESNKKMIPDVVVYYPGKDLIIDSKVSLTAYADWSNAVNEDERATCAKQHILSIKSHIKELTDKSYAAYRKEVKRETLDYCVMFVPNEGAFQLMRDTEPSLWYDAYQNKVIITSELSLFSLLKMIENFWVKVEQNKNREEIIRAAENMLSRVGDFYKTVTEMEDIFFKMQNKFTEAKGKLCDGRQSIAVSGRQLVKLGVKSDSAKPLPEPDQEE